MPIRLSVLFALAFLASACGRAHGAGDRAGIACGDSTCPVAEGSFCVHCVDGPPLCAVVVVPRGDLWTPGSECPGADLRAPDLGVFYCDGPEDCAAPEACVSYGGEWATCAVPCFDCAPPARLCHDDADCAPSEQCVAMADYPASVCAEERS